MKSYSSHHAFDYTILDNLLEGCTILDHEWRLMYVNRAAECHNRITASESLGRKNTELWPGIEETELFNRMKRCMEQRIPDKVENEFRYPDGKKGNFIVSILPVPQGILVMSVDITDQKETERILKESEEKYRSIYVHSTVGILFSAPDGRILAANDFACRMFGMSQEEMIAAGRDGLVDLSDPRVRELVAERRRNGYAKGEIRFVRKNGQKFPAEISSVIFTDVEGNERTSLVIRDLTEEKEAAGRIRHSEEKFNKAFLNSPDAISITRLNDGLILDVNNSFLEISGYNREEVIMHTSLEMDFWTDPAHRDQYVRQLLAHGRVREFETVYRTKSGNLRTTLVSGELFEVGDDRYILGIIRDITEKKRSEEELKTTNFELRSINRIIAASRDMMVDRIAVGQLLNEILTILEMDGGAVFTWQQEKWYSTEAWQEGQRRMDSDLLPEYVTWFIQEPGACKQLPAPLILRNKEEITAAFASTAVSPEALRFYSLHPVAAGERYIGLLCLYSTSDRTPGDRSLILLSSIITQLAIALDYSRMLNEIRDHAADLEQKVTERTEQLTRINKELESFSYSISHDLRAPLRAVSGFSQIIGRRHRASLNEEGSRYIDHIISSSARMEQLINDLLSYSRLGRKSVRLTPVRLDILLHEVTTDYHEIIESTHAQITLPEEPCIVIGDKTLVRQVISNLLDNAIKYRDLSRTPVIGVTVVPGGIFTAIQISDNGIGIPGEYFGKIFNVFQRLHGEEQYPGTGIGLATVRKAMDLLGGFVTVDSTVGTGTTFTLHFQQPN